MSCPNCGFYQDLEPKKVDLQVQVYYNSPNTVEAIVCESCGTVYVEKENIDDIWNG